ncbi:MAG: multifunctional oxoglutarate decarboxylase/oxoglutarate dehydrogenase thiamine pyrophosphate-binding subunit/dihydrolipoyllysine-residue succinyltransferase subunit [Actinobacteria bacterium]|nr:multifunctional oxoglutarate decarboxylase/oxoglutarate dehydrogenase thiamine pyrophosphate-binding subunit/dihydrolipoyllysine-residue succinyltransferase subunit [Actinomycetota bacterium]MSW21834.1 multifunctional oxoglutarate decarboxylase/oxoglutarate dehydrogenase thiamine pyrophosphate-binding subunit/dihydrolipoyllysine-residue succinyltransferase subunit [Actinomycetota bacterium]MSX03644.1 multifunctional oxoglutarate decarboxylase/oxoglutarate dehydrogenase thiamine pyrophosphate-b
MESGASRVSASGSNTPANHFGGSFGPNEWLVDEMFEKYLVDPNSVDAAWVDFFANYKPNANGASAPVIPTLDNAPKGGTPPLPKKTIDPTALQVPVAATQVGAPVAPVAQATPVAPVAQATPVAPVAPVAQATPADPIVKPIPTLVTPSASTLEPIRGVSARVVQSMEASLTVPTATSVRALPAKLMIDNRTVINNHLKRSRGGKVSFTHIIGYAMISAIRQMPEMNAFFGEIEGKPAIGKPEHINLGIAIDLAKPDGSRQLLVPSIKGCESLDFAQFWASYEETVRKARGGSLTVEDFAGTTVSLTNPGTIGTVHSVPRLVQGQGLILGVGAMDYPAEFHGANEETLAELAISKVITLTSTYDHRIIQGAQSGDFLKRIHELLLGENGFYDEIFAALRIPYVPIRWVVDMRSSSVGQVGKTARVQQLINAYRTTGHLMADIDPLKYVQRSHPDLDVVTHGLSLWDLDREFATDGFGGKPVMKLRRILGTLRDSYCRTIGVEYMYIENPEERAWIQEHVEVGSPRLPREEQLRILYKLNSAESFEAFLQTKYVGQKRFSLEGGETLIPLLDAIISAAADRGLDEVCVGMPHRGRLNVLANIAGKSYGQIFQEFEGHYAENQVHGSGDVKYHLGTAGTFTAISGATTKIYLAANPSHLEAVNPVLEGITRAKQDKLNLKEIFSILPILMHGDAAFAGQGVVSETLNLSQLKGYRVGGTIHIVVNNQVGFTTSPHAARSSRYSTDIAKMIQAPVFHVNADDPESVVRVARIAFEYRQKFNKDVVIDMICYRLRGHNEGDEPSFTQPMMYKLVEAKRSTRKLYTEALTGRGDITVEEAEDVLRDYQAQLDAVYNAVHNNEPEHDESLVVPIAPPPESVDTSVDEATLRKIVATQSAIPEGFLPHAKLTPQLAKRVDMLDEGTVDWSTGELLAMGSLLLEGYPIRLAGQDVKRGTFSNRHAVVVDQNNGSDWTPLRSLISDENQFFVFDSLLSEYAAMGFEYGYSVERESALVMWEAQFGDFANGAQTIIDEFISSALQKWGERSSLVLLLPHGYEGQGPDHSSGRIERFLALCAELNMTVAQPSSPASYFHLLRWHMKNPARRPLIVFEPKSMLRLKAAASGMKDFTTGTFRPLIDDATVANATRVIFCSGKVFHDLVAERTKLGESSTAIIRLEQLYPFPTEQFSAVAAKHPNANLLWVQDEPANQGPWPFVSLTTSEFLDGRTLRRVSRRATASPATGSHHLHEEEQKALMMEAFTR